MLKKIILVLFIAISLFSLAGCDDGSSSSGNSISVAPPSWLIGTWSGSLLGVSMTYEFTSNNIYMETMGYRLSLLEGLTSITEDINTSSEYQITYTDSEGATDSDHFVKVSNTEMTLDSVITFTKQ